MKKLHIISKLKNEFIFWKIIIIIRFVNVEIEPRLRYLYWVFCFPFWKAIEGVFRDGGARIKNSFFLKNEVFPWGFLLVYLLFILMLDSIGSIIYIYIYIYIVDFPFWMKDSLQQWTFQLIKKHNKVMDCNQFFFFFFFYYWGKIFATLWIIFKMSKWKFLKRENFVMFRDFGHFLK
jgi:hypothetical protein